MVVSVRHLFYLFLISRAHSKYQMCCPIIWLIIFMSSSLDIQLWTLGYTLNFPFLNTAKDKEVKSNKNIQFQIDIGKFS